MELRITIPGRLTVNEIIRKLGRALMFVYILLTFISRSDYLPANSVSLALYGFILLGCANFVVNAKGRIVNTHMLWYLVFIAMSLFWVLILWQNWPDAEWLGTVYQMVVVLALSLSLSQFVESRKDIRMVSYAYTLGAVLLMLFLAMAGRLHEDERLGETIMGNANIFADFYMTAAIMALWMAVNGRNVWERLLFWTGIIVIFYGLLLSGGRKFILIPFIVLYIMLLMRKDKQGRNHIILYSVMVAALFGGVIWVMMSNETLYQSVGYRMEYLFNMISGEGNIGSSNETRKQMRMLALSEGFESPLWGHGFDAFKNLGLRRLGYYAYSHNNWTEMWYNYGLIGFVVYYWFYGKQVLSLWKYRKMTQDLAAFGIAIIISLFIYEYGAVSYFETQNQTLLCLVAIMYGICQKGDGKKSGKDKNVSSPSVEG